LHGALVQERLLYGMQAVALGEAFNGGNLPLRNIADPRDAGPARLAIDQNGTGAALAFAAAILAAGQIEMVAQHEQQAGVGIRVNGVGTSVDVQLSSCSHSGEGAFRRSSI
jgi:hypothetical protein